MLQAISDPYCQTPCLWLCLFGDRLSVRSTPFANRQRPRYAAKLAASRATSSTGLLLLLSALTCQMGQIGQDARSGDTLEGCVFMTEEQLDDMMLQLNNETTDSDVIHSRQKRTLIDFAKSPSSKWSMPITYKFYGSHCECCTE